MNVMHRLACGAIGLTVVVAGMATWAPAASAAPCGDGTLSFSGGQGTTASPYQISTEADLQALRDANTTGDYDGSTHGYYDCTYLQTRNITITGGAWKHGIGFTAPAAGAWWAPFQGVYDGGGYTITNLSIDPAGESTASHRTQKLGFIGSNQSGTGALRNLNLVNATMTCGADALDAGLLIGQTLGSVSRSSATGTVDCSGATLSDFVGGAIGYTDGSVSNVWVSGSVSISLPGGFSPNSVGGVIGKADSSASIQYLIGRVTLTNSGSAIWAGDLIGRPGGSYGNSFAESGLTPSAGQLLGTGASVSGIAYGTSTQLKTISTYSGWSISAGVNTSTIWGIDPAINGGYPFLQALASSTANNNYAEIPAAILQELPAGEGNTCTGINDRPFAYNTGLTGGWTLSSAAWPNGGKGGPVCTRTLVYVGNGWTIQSG